MNGSARVVGDDWMLSQAADGDAVAAGIDSRDLLPGQASRALDINGRGDAIVEELGRWRGHHRGWGPRRADRASHGRSPQQPASGGGEREDLGGGGDALDRWGEGFDINDRGQVAGYHGGVAVLWDDGTITDISPAGSWGSNAYGMNEVGQAVGLAQIASRFSHAFFWDGSSSTDLGTLGGVGMLSRTRSTIWCRSSARRKRRSRRVPRLPLGGRRHGRSERSADRAVPVHAGRCGGHQQPGADRVPRRGRLGRELGRPAEPHPRAGCVFCCLRRCGGDAATNE